MHWIFGYGSVIWNPGFPYLEKRLVKVSGWSRRFWQGSTDHRGVPGAPGRVVTLVPSPGSECWGMGFRLDHQLWDETVRQLDIREQGGYTRHWLDTEGPGGIHCLAYVARPDNPDYLGDSDPLSIATQIATARGPSGNNRDYLFRLAASLRELQVDDAHIFELEALVRSVGQR